MPDLLKTKDTRSRDDVATLLETLAARIRDGHITLSQGANSLDLEVPESVVVEVEVSDSVKPRRIKREVEIEMSWEVDAKGVPTGVARGKGGLSIS